jgi:hypothetical protein
VNVHEQEYDVVLFPPTMVPNPENRVLIKELEKKDFY